MSIDKVRGCVFRAHSGPLGEVIILHNLRWFGLVLRIPAVFARDENGWKKCRGSQAMIWCRWMKKLASILTLTGTFRLRGWHPGDEECC